MATFDIWLFGAIEIRRDGALLTDFRSQKALVLLAYLICESRPVTRDYLAGLGWPEMEQSQALGLLRRSLHDLNNQLPGCLAIDRRTVRFSPTTSTIVDIHQMADLMARNDLDAWVAAVAVYRAPFLHGIYVDDAPELESWLRHEQERWQRVMVQMLQRLIEHHTAQVDYGSALQYTQRILTLEPWREEVHRQAMLLLARTGQVSAALAQYERCRQALAEELAVAPTRETENLYTRIKAIAHAMPATLPVTTTPFVGRTEEVAELTRLLADPNSRLITLVGAGGMGKTRLALEVARKGVTEQCRTFLHGVVFVPLVGVDTGAQVVSALAQALAFTFQAQGDLETQLLNYLKDKELLLLLDNFEQLIGERSAAFVLKLLQAAPDLKLLITSRTRLNLQGEQLYWMQGLHVPTAHVTTAQLSLADSVKYSGIQLFMATAQRVGALATLAADQIAPITAICQMVQGMPLAIELAAAWMSVLGPTEIAAEISRNLDFLASDMHDLPVRQRSMRAVFATSWRLLTQTEQAVFQQLSVFRGSFIREAAQTVTGASWSVLMGLIHKSFVQRMPDERYQIHELLRQFAGEKLAESPGQQTETQVRHSDYYLAFVIQRAHELMGPQQPVLLNEIGHEIDNIRAGWLWAASQGEGDSLNNALDGLYEYYQNRSQWSEGVELFIQTCATLQRSSTDGATSRIFGRIQARQGAFAFKLGRYEQGCLLLQTSLALARQLDDKPEIAFCLNFIGMITWWQGGELAALPLLEESLALSRMLGDLAGIATALHSLTFVVHTTSAYRQAKPFAEESLAVSRQLGNTHHIAENLDKLGAIAFGLGDYTAAIEYYQQALAVFRQLNHRAAMAFALAGLARGRYGAGERRHASLLPLLEEAVACSREVGDFFSLFVAVGVMGQIAGWLGDYTTCERCAQEIVDQLQDAQHPFRSSCLGLLGEAKRGLGQLGLARHYLHAALVATLKTQTKLVTTGQTVLLSWAKLLWAESLLPIALNLSSRRAAQQAQALEIATVLLHEPKVWPIWKDHTRSFVTELETRLPLAVVAAAKAQGGMKTLAQIVTEIAKQQHETIL